VAGNIPYYITSPLLEKALTPPLPASVTFLMQEEVARRLAALPGSEDYGALTVGVAAAAAARIALRVGRGAFTPPPRVDSAVVHLVPHPHPPIAPARVGALRRLVVSLFSYRRKRMLRALREATGLDAVAAAAVLDRAGIDPDLRPEAVTLPAFVALLEAIDPA
jgi:16S rRNA (adenine1518-N6/adenine1519-N6)-dimethyltransferase